MRLEALTERLKTGQPVVFATFGDSITWPCFHTDFRQNYITLTVDALRKTYPQAQVQIVHAGNMGSAGRGLDASRFDRYVLAHHPDAVFIMLGMNDCGAGPNGLDTYDRNLTELIRKTRQAGALPILVTQNEILYDSPGDGTGRWALSLYMAREREVAKREGTLLVDAFALWKPLLANRAEHILRLNDAIHPNLAGHRLFAKAILDTLWPEAAAHISTEIRASVDPESPAPRPCLLPGPAGKQILRTAEGVWIALSGRRRGATLTDLVVSFTRAERPHWSDFRHVMLIGTDPDAVFDFQDRTITAGLLLQQQDRLYVVFSWNVGVFYVALNLAQPDWEQRVEESRAWLEQAEEPYVRPIIISKMDKDGNVLQDAFPQPGSHPGVFCSDFAMAPGAGFEVVEGEAGIALILKSSSGNSPAQKTFFPGLYAAYCVQTVAGETFSLTEQREDGPLQLGRVGDAAEMQIEGAGRNCLVPAVSVQPLAVVRAVPDASESDRWLRLAWGADGKPAWQEVKKPVEGSQRKIPLPWSDGGRNGISWQEVPATFAYQSHLNAGGNSLGMLVEEDGDLQFQVCPLGENAL
jgi:lysophospholipase L1-like esterase